MFSLVALFSGYYCSDTDISLHRYLKLFDFSLHSTNLVWANSGVGKRHILIEG